MAENGARRRGDRAGIPDPGLGSGDKSGAAGEEEMDSVEKIFAAQEVPSWKGQLTFRAFAVSLLLSVAFSFIVMKLNLTTGIIPSLNVAAGLLGFFFVKTWTTIFGRLGVLPFTRQENTVIQTCVVASSGIAFSGKRRCCFTPFLFICALQKMDSIKYPRACCRKIEEQVLWIKHGIGNGWWRGITFSIAVPVQEQEGLGVTFSG